MTEPAAGPEGSLSALALNVAAPTKESARGLLEYLWSRDEAVLVLSEVTRGEGSRLILDVCRAAGHAVLHAPLSGRDRGVALIVREPELAVGAPSFPCGPRVVRVRLGEVDMLGVYGAASDPVRYSSAAQRERKRAWLGEFTSLMRGVAGESSGPILLAGDLNIVDPDDRDGLPYVLAQERAAYADLIDLGLRDAYRDAAGGTAPTWLDHTGVGCRYDHVFVRDLGVLGAEIDDAPRLRGRSDHSALAVRVRT